MPTTLFGDGAFLRDRHGVRFLSEFRPQGEVGIGKEELVLAMAEMARQGRAEPDGSVWLDAREVPKAVLGGYPWLYDFLLKQGIDLSREMIEVLPAAHTSLGGIAIDVERATTVPGLFAAGEAAAGVHGAGRLAGGSGTDVIVSGARVGASAAAADGMLSWSTLQAAFDEAFLDSPPSPQDTTPEEETIRTRARSLMSAAAGIWRNGPALAVALAETAALYAEIEPSTLVPPASRRVLLADILMVSGMILASALNRQESRGAHQRTDHPATDAACGRSTAVPWLSGRPFVEG